MCFSDWHPTFALTLVLTVQLLSLVVQILFSQVLDVQEPLDNFVHGSIYEGQGQVTQGVVGQPLLERATRAAFRDLISCNLQLLPD